MSKNKTTKGNSHARIFFKGVFGFAEYQDTCTNIFAYKFTLQRNNDEHVLSPQAGATDAANVALAGRVIIDDKKMYVPPYIPNISNQKLMLEPIVTRAATELSYINRSFYMKEVTTENNWNFELGVGAGIDILIYVIVEFMQRNQFNQQRQQNDRFPISETKCSKCSKSYWKWKISRCSNKMYICFW